MEKQRLLPTIKKFFIRAELIVFPAILLIAISITTKFTNNIYKLYIVGLFIQSVLALYDS